MKIRTMKEIGAIVREARRASGLTQGDLAIRMNKHQYLISQIENGKDTVSVNSVLDALNELGITIDIKTPNIDNTPNSQEIPEIEEQPPIYRI